MASSSLFSFPSKRWRSSARWRPQLYTTAVTAFSVATKNAAAIAARPSAASLCVWGSYERLALTVSKCVCVCVCAFFSLKLLNNFGWFKYPFGRRLVEEGRHQEMDLEPFSVNVPWAQYEVWKNCLKSFHFWRICKRVSVGFFWQFLKFFRKQVFTAYAVFQCFFWMMVWVLTKGILWFFFSSKRKLNSEINFCFWKVL